MKTLIIFLFTSLFSDLLCAGELNFTAFKNDLNAKNITLNIKNEGIFTTNTDGNIYLSLTEGHYQSSIKEGEETVDINFYIGTDEVTHIIYRAFNSKVPTVNISSPEITKDNPKITELIANYKGIVTDENSNPIAHVKIFFQGLDIHAETNDRGEYNIAVPNGNFTVSFLHSKYATLTKKNIKIKAGQDIKHKVALTKSTMELDEFVVLAPFVKGSLTTLIEYKKNSSQVAEVIGSEQISKSGDSDAASSLKRITGLSIIDGKYVYIRGLGERYSNVLLDQTNIPSPDPTRRVVQLDLFPSGIIDKMIVQKSYSPEYPGAFGGGTVIIDTKAIPEKFMAQISLSTTFEDDTGDFNTYKGGKKDWIGYDDGSRNLPNSIRKATANGRRLSESSSVNTEGYTKEELKQFSKDMRRNYNISKNKTTLPPSISFAIGDIYKRKGNKYGYLVSMLYENKAETKTKERFSYKSDGVDDYSRFMDNSERTIKLAGMLNLGLNLRDRNKISVNNIFLRKTTDIVSIDTKSSQSDSDSNYKDISLIWQERELKSHILKGEHVLGKNRKRIFEWKAATSSAKRLQPDSRSYQQDLKDGIYYTSTAGKRNQKSYNELNDKSTDYLAKIQLPLLKNDSFKQTLSFGAQYTSRHRDSLTKRFKFGQISADIAAEYTGNPNILTQSLEDICTNVVIDNDGCLLEDITVASDRYSANQKITGQFFNSEFNFKGKLSMNIGARFEESTQDIKTYEGVDRTPISASLYMKDILPAVNITYHFTDNLQLRAAYSETVSRPDFKDLNPGSYYDDEKGRSITGNLNLQGTIIKNYDTRFEYYFGLKENISFGLSQKVFKNPIEEVAGSFNDDGELVFSESQFQLANIGNAKSSALEVELRKNLDFLHKYLNKWSLSANYSRIISKVDVFDNLSSQITNKTRPLQGQSDYVANVNLEYESESLGLSSSLLYNVFGRRIDAVGTKPYDDIYEEEFQRLDYVLSKNYHDNTKIKFKIQNIIDPLVLKTEAGKIKEKYKKGRAASIGISRTF